MRLGHSRAYRQARTTLLMFYTETTKERRTWRLLEQLLTEVGARIWRTTEKLDSRLQRVPTSHRAAGPPRIFFTIRGQLPLGIRRDGHC
jgi:hypothetical protein